MRAGLMKKGAGAATVFTSRPNFGNAFQANVARHVLLVKQHSSGLLDKLSQRPLE
jgi:hypothetical protein